MPLLCAFLILAGLLAALLGAGIWQLASWMALVTPLIILVGKIFR